MGMLLTEEQTVQPHLGLLLAIATHEGDLDFAGRLIIGVAGGDTSGSDSSK